MTIDIFKTAVLHHSKRNYRSLTFLYAGLATLLLFLTIRTTIYTNYINSDIPVEMLVYTQTSPDLLLINKIMEKQYPISESQEDPSIVIDQTNGFTWPWSWYLRNRGNVQYPKLNPETYEPHNQPDMMIVHSSNNLAVENALPMDYLPGMRVAHRWWFPEKYKNNFSTTFFFFVFNFFL